MPRKFKYERVLNKREMVIENYKHQKRLKETFSKMETVTIYDSRGEVEKVGKVIQIIGDKILVQFPWYKETFTHHELYENCLRKQRAEKRKAEKKSSKQKASAY